MRYVQTRGSGNIQSRSKLKLAASIFFSTRNWCRADAPIGWEFFKSDSPANDYHYAVPLSDQDRRFRLVNGSLNEVWKAERQVPLRTILMLDVLTSHDHSPQIPQHVKRSQQRNHRSIG
jgi:hypothetical protein